MCTDIYCNGKLCALRTTCRRYSEGQRVILNMDGDTDQHRFMDNCNPETREYFVSDAEPETNKQS